MDSPGDSTPRCTPVRFTPTSLPRGQHHPRSTHSSSLLDDVLSEKKMALMKSPEVIRFLESVQASVQERNTYAQSCAHSSQGMTSSNPEGVKTSKEYCNQPAQMTTTMTPSVQGPDSVHKSLPLAVQVDMVTRQDDQGRCGNSNPSLVTDGAEYNSNCSGHPARATQDHIFTDSSLPGPSTAAVQFVSFSTPASGGKKLQTVTVASKCTLAESQSQQVNVEVCRSTKSHNQDHNNISAVPAPDALHTSALPHISTQITALHRTVPSTYNNIGVDTSVHSHNPHIFSTAPIHIDSSRHRLITQWLNATVPSVNIESENDEPCSSNKGNA